MPLIRFGEFELDEQTFELRRNGSLIRIQQQPARVLAFLLNHQGALVTRKQIQDAIWGGDTFVDFEQSLNFCIRQIRITLNDPAEKPLFIETLPRLGYRFLSRAETVVNREPATRHRRIRIGVLPIEDMGGPTEDYFAIGLTEDMISALARIDPERLRVTVGPRFPSGSLAREQLDSLQREFDLDYLLRGSVRRSAGAVRITAQLIDLRDKAVMWSEVYDRPSSDLLGVQEEVTRRVSQSLVLELLPGTVVGSRTYARSSAAYDAYLKGRFFWHKMTGEGIRSSVASFNEALAIDPKFAPAYAGLADCYAQMGSIRVGMMKPLDALAEARTYLNRAMELDDTLAEAHCTSGLIKSWYEFDWAGAEREFQLALRLDPGQVTALLWQSLYLSAMGRHHEAIASMKRARESEPISPSINMYLGVAQTHAGHYDLAIRQLQQAIELDPHYYRPYMFLGRVLMFTGRSQEAIDNYQTALSINPDNLESVAFMGSAKACAGDRQGAVKMIKRVIAAENKTEPAILVASIYASLGDTSPMFEWLERAVERRSTPIYIALISAEFHPYRTDPRFHGFLNSIGLSNLARH
jgi:TolB-like protein/tetratricopeptide (TPR) repeat protein